MGVQHFYLYNNNSNDNYLEILTPYLDAKEVDLFDWPVETYSQQDYLYQLQLPVYRHALELAKAETCWIAFIDLDEFLFPVEKENLLEFLEEYRDCSAIAVNWQIFGTSFITNLADHQLITENFILKAPQEYAINRIVKLIVQPQDVLKIDDPHFFTLISDKEIINSSREPVRSKESNQVLVNKVRINHYWFGDKRWFCENKIPRREKWGLYFSKKQQDDFFV